MEALLLDVISWSEQMSGTAQLGDQRRTHRLARVLAGLATHPVGSLPTRLPKHDLKAAYRLCAQEQVTHQAIAQAFRCGTLQLLDEMPGDILVLHDTTELNFFMRFSLHAKLSQRGVRKPDATILTHDRQSFHRARHIEMLTGRKRVGLA